MYTGGAMVAMVVLMHKPCAEMLCTRPRMLYELSCLVDASGCEISKRSCVDVTRVVPNKCVVKIYAVPK
jgi:hypothetical protein